MAHKPRPGDRVKRTRDWTGGSRFCARPLLGDVGTVVDVSGNGGYIRVVYDRPDLRAVITHTNIFSGKQAWGSAAAAVHYIGMRVNPSKV